MVRHQFAEQMRSLCIDFTEWPEHLACIKKSHLRRVFMERWYSNCQFKYLCCSPHKSPSDVHRCWQQSTELFTVSLLKTPNLKEHFLSGGSGTIVMFVSTVAGRAFNPACQNSCVNGGAAALPVFSVWHVKQALRIIPLLQDWKWVIRLVFSLVNQRHFQNFST